MQEKTLQSTMVFQGRLIHLEVMDVALEDGTRAVREVVRHPGAVAVLARTREERYLLVRQYRKPLERVMEEVIAGTLHPGEPPETCARREVEEETGHCVEQIERLGVIYPSPGYLDEEITVFRAEVAPAPTRHTPDPDERVEPVERAGEDVERMIRDGEITDAKTLAVWCLHQQTPLQEGVARA